MWVRMDILVEILTAGHKANTNNTFPRRFSAKIPQTPPTGIKKDNGIQRAQFTIASPPLILQII